MNFSFKKSKVFCSLLLFLLLGCDFMSKKTDPEIYFHGNQLSLAQEISRNNLNKENELLAKTDLNSPGKQDMTLLFYAAMVAENDPKKLPAISLLVKNGADPLQNVPEMGTLADIFATYPHPDFIEALLKGGMSANAKSGSRPIILLAANDKCIAILQTLVKYGANINITNSLGETALTRALITNQLIAVKWLLNRNADPNMKEYNGQTFMKKIDQMILENPVGEQKDKLIKIKQLAIEKGGTEYHGE